MTDIAIRQLNTPSAPPAFDIALDGADLARDDGLRTAVILSLFLDRRADANDVREGEDRHGSWMDQYLDSDSDLLGSRLWLLTREKETAATLNRARTYAQEALAWMIDDAIAQRIEVDAEWTRSGVLGLRIEIVLRDGNRWTDRLMYSVEG